MRAFVLAGSGSLGAVQAGMLRALTAGVVPEFVVGISAGALNGRAVGRFRRGQAGGIEPAEVWCGMRRGRPPCSR